MSGNITFKDASIEDLPSIVDIYNSISRMVTVDTEPVSINGRLDWFNDHNSYKRPLWVVGYEGKICGWKSVQSFYGRPAYNRTAAISIYLHEDFRGKGLGKKILNKVILEKRFLKLNFISSTTWCVSKGVVGLLQQLFFY